MTEPRATPHPSSPAPFDEGLSLDQIVGFADRYWLLILGCSLGLAALVLIVFGLLMPPEFKTAATLVAVNPTISSELRPEPLSIHAYKTLLESDAVVSEARRRLVEAGRIEVDERLRIGDELVVRIFVSRGPEVSTLSPMLEAEARADDPEKAADIANAWADVFLEQVRLLMRQATLPEVDFVEGQYPRTTEDLHSEEDSWLELSEEYEAKRRRAADAGDQRVAATRKRTVELIAAHRAESRSLIEEYAGEQMRALGRDGSTEDAGEILERLAELTGLRAQMAQIPDLLVLEKAITDDALWQTVTRDAQVDTSRSLKTEEPNPVYSELELRAMQLEGELRRAAGERLEAVAAIARGLESLQQQRSAGLAQLREERELKLALVERAQRFEIQEIELERGVRLTQARRVVDRLSALERQLSRGYSEAILARAQEGLEFVYLASPAVVVASPEDRQLPLKVFLALLVGGLLGVTIALVREVHSRRRGG